jgi:FKBP-type peptidyl-prolyl cis-trans isomerase
MKKIICASLLAVAIAAPAVQAQEKPETFEQKLSYSMGIDVGTYFKRAGDEIDKTFLLVGIQDALNGAKPVLTSEEMLSIKKDFAAKMQAKQTEKLAEMKDKNKKEGDTYLAENKKKAGVVETASGLQYEVLKEGTGEKAKATDTVKVEYVGTLISGKEFDSTVKHGKPAQFQVDQVIPGWSEALQLMNPGTKLRLAIPSSLAYGEQGAAPMIEPNSVLLFDVELLGIENGAPAAGAPAAGAQATDAPAAKQ